MRPTPARSTLALFALCLAPIFPLVAQREEGATRRFVIEQRSIWSSNALSGPLALLRDTLVGFTLHGDTIGAELGWEAKGVLIRSTSGGKLQLRPSAADTMRSSMRPTSDAIATIGSPLLVLLTAAPPRGQAERWVDTVIAELAFAPTPETEFRRDAPSDSLMLRVVRRGHTTRASNGRLVSIVDLTWRSRHRNTIDREMASGSTQRIWTGEGAGRMSLWHQRGGREIDSLELKLELGGAERFRPDAGGEQVAAGHLSLAAKGRWVIHDERAEADAWWESARRGVWQEALPASSIADSALGDRLVRNDSVLGDSLLAARSGSASPEERSRIEALLSCGAGGCHRWGVVAIAGIGLDDLLRYSRKGDVYLATSILTHLQYGSAPVLDSGAAVVMVDLMGTLERQRQYRLDRSDIFAGFLALTAHVDSVTPEAGRVLLAASRATDDADARNLFLLLAYRAAPREMLSVIRAQADTTSGYGPIARRYVEGNPEDFGWSWGLYLRDSGYVSRWAGRGFPGFHAPFDSILGWRPDYWDAPRKREWMRAHEPDAISLLQGRLRDLEDRKVKAAVAFLLLDLGDTTIVPLLRQLVQSQGPGPAIYIPLQYEELLAVPVSGSLLTSIQRELIAYALGRDLTTDSGAVLEPFRPHNERPDQHYLLSEGLTPEVVEEVTREGVLTLVTAAQLQAIADREGISMALYLRPPQRFGRRIEASVALTAMTRPGTGCLCGGVALFQYKIGADGVARPTYVANWIQ